MAQLEDDWTYRSSPFKLLYIHYNMYESVHLFYISLHIHPYTFIYPRILNV